MRSNPRRHLSDSPKPVAQVQSPQDFASTLTWTEIPADVRAVLKRSLLDTIGVAAIGSRSEISPIVRDHAARFWRADPAEEARLPFDGRPAARAGAAFAGAFTIDSVDAHDGNSHLKGHAGSAVLPALWALAETRQKQNRGLDGRELLTAMTVGYEIGYRSGLALHAMASDYHSSGAWTAVGVAAMAGRVLGLAPEPIRHAMGTAEYHGPRGPMMRCIDRPSMVRDGVGWGAPTGMTAAELAATGFRGAPAATVELAEAAPFFADLGGGWRLRDTHYKRYPVCRWAHPAMDAALALKQRHSLATSDIIAIRVKTFHNATRLAGQSVETADDLAYSIVWPLAVTLVHDGFGAAELEMALRQDPETRRLAAITELVDDPHYTRISVGVRWAEVELTLADGTVLGSGPYRPVGDPENPLSDSEIADKFHAFADPVIGAARAAAIASACGDIEDLPPGGVARLLDLVLSP